MPVGHADGWRQHQRGASLDGTVPRRTTSPAGTLLAPAPNAKWLTDTPRGSVARNGRRTSRRYRLPGRHDRGAYDRGAAERRAGQRDAGPGRRHVAARRTSRGPQATADAITGGRDGWTGWTGTG